jgi:hypothetical protein
LTLSRSSSTRCIHTTRSRSLRHPDISYVRPQYFVLRALSRMPRPTVPLSVNSRSFLPPRMWIILTCVFFLPNIGYTMPDRSLMKHMHLRHELASHPPSHPSHAVWRASKPSQPVWNTTSRQLFRQLAVGLRRHTSTTIWSSRQQIACHPLRCFSGLQVRSTYSEDEEEAAEGPEVQRALFRLTPERLKGLAMSTTNLQML